MPKVVVYKGRNVLFEHFVKKDVVTIGRSEDADIPLDSAAVSRLHARIRKQGNTWMIEETGAKNGVFVNGQMITVKPLKHGDSIEIAQHILTWHRPDSEARDERDKDSGKPGAAYRLSTSDVEAALSEKKLDDAVVRDRLDSAMRTAYVGPEQLEQMRQVMQTRRGAHLAAVFSDGTRKEVPLDRDTLTVGWSAGSAISLPGTKWLGKDAATLRARPGGGHDVERHSFWTTVRCRGETLKVGIAIEMKDGDLLEVGPNEFKYHPAMEQPKPSRATSTPAGKPARLGKS